VTLGSCACGPGSPARPTPACGHRRLPGARCATDLLSLPPDLFEALQAFEGRSATRARETIAAEHGLDIEPAVVARLLDFEVLVPVPPARPA
jgi:hypothetical protein